MFSTEHKHRAFEWANFSGLHWKTITLCSSTRCGVFTLCNEILGHRIKVSSRVHVGESSMLPWRIPLVDATVSFCLFTSLTINWTELVKHGQWMIKFHEIRILVVEVQGIEASGKCSWSEICWGMIDSFENFGLFFIYF